MFARLPLAGDLTSLLAAALVAQGWRECQQAVAQTLEVLYRRQAETGLATEVGQAAEPFFDRPFLGVRAGVSRVLLGAVEDPQVRALRPGLGSVEQWVDNVRVLTDPAVRVWTARVHLLTASAS
jgi:hypothetical protein